MRGKKITLKIHKKSRFQPNEKKFAESCSVRYKHLLRAKKILGVIGTLNSSLDADMQSFRRLSADLVRRSVGVVSNGSEIVAIAQIFSVAKECYR